MAYIELQDLIDELGEAKLIELTDDVGDGEIGEAAAVNAIEDAIGEFESYARVRYTLPVLTTYRVKSACLKIAVYRLFSRRATFADEGILKVKQAAYNETVGFLKDLAAGRAALDVPAAQETLATPATSDEVLTNAGRSKFTDSRLKAF